MSLKNLTTSEVKVAKLWKKISGSAFDSFLQEIEINLMEGYESLIQEKSESIISRLWEIQLEQGFNTLDETFFYPTGTKFFYHTKESTIVVIEQPPIIRTINVNTHGLIPNTHGLIPNYDDGIKRYTISLPYVIFVFYFVHSNYSCLRSEHSETHIEDDDYFCIQTCACFFANKSLKSMQTKIAYAALPNIHVNGDICFGHNDKDFCKDYRVHATSENLINSIENAIAFFWGSNFNVELSEHYVRNGLGFVDWDSKTKDDPDFVLNVTWKRQIPFGKMLQCLPGMNNQPIRELSTPNAQTFAMVHEQLDDVYCNMMGKCRDEVRNVLDFVKGTYEFGGVEECFHTIVNLAARKAHQQFFDALEKSINEVPFDFREEVEKHIEKSLKSAMMAIR